MRGSSPGVLALLACAAAAVGCGGPSAAAPEVAGAPARASRSITPVAWTSTASDGVLARVEPASESADGALRLSFDFQGHGGYAGARRPFSVELPDNYELSFDIRGSAPTSDLQVKLLDASAENVWWFREREFRLPSEWTRLRFKKRELEFAWGPTAERQLRAPASLELVVTAGLGGGRGTLEVSNVELKPLPVPPAEPPPPMASATLSLPGSGASAALDGRDETSWRSPREGTPELELDLGYAREFGGLSLHWADNAHASRYDVDVSLDHERWQTVRRVTEGNGGDDALLLPEAEARYVRLRLHEGPGEGYALRELEVRDLAFGATPNAFVSALARDMRRGRLPRAYLGEQPYWTLVGVDGGRDSGLFSEDGALEVGRGGFSIEPFVVSGGTVLTWADVDVKQSLRDGYLPLPSVTWQHRDWELSVSTAAHGEPGAAALGARYVLTNRTARPASLKLVLAVRPLQVNPPTQSLNLLGGVSPIRALAWDGSTLRVNDQKLVVPLVAPAHVELASFDAAELPNQPARAGKRDAVSVADPNGLASGLLSYDIQLPPHGSAAVGLLAPVEGSGVARPTSANTDPLAELAHLEEATAAAWRERLNRVQLTVPPAGRAVADTLRSCLAQMLMSREGPVLRPGTRSYARSWIRDGAMMAESLLRLGHASIAADYLAWYAPHQFDSGKVPCCVDARGADPVPENDSHGQLIFLAAELYRFARDRSRLEAAWPHVEAAAAYMEQLRQSERTAANQSPERRHYYGLLPPSISHEGYSDKPAYSYWDDFWGLIGYQDAAWVAEVLGRSEAHERLARQRDEFQSDLHASLLASVERHDIPFLPGAADRGDFDATSTTIALAPGREGGRLPRPLLEATFDRYYRDFLTRRSGARSWDAYTPYELRLVGSFIRLGWRDKAREVLEFQLGDRRPAAWNQWAEVVGREARQPRFLGEMPHAWISSDYIRSVLDMFAYPRQSDASLVLGAGVPLEWLGGRGVAVRGLRTHYGALDLALRGAGGRITLDISGDVPPGGFIVPWPWPTASPRSAATVNGQPGRWVNGELRVDRSPARVVVTRP